MSDNDQSLPSIIKNSTANPINPMAAKPNTTVAYTDGACKGNPGAGGWGAYLIFSDGNTQDLYGGESDTTNNRMELMGAIKALQYSAADIKLEIWTDSSYVKKGITEWIGNWKRRGWKTASNKPVANKDLWQQLDALSQAREVTWHWVKGHAGHAGNEKADELANLGVISSNEPDKSTDVQTSKKKELIMSDNKSIANDDWLSYDPLGLDDSDEALEEEWLADEQVADTSLKGATDNELANNITIRQDSMNAPYIGNDATNHHAVTTADTDLSNEANEANELPKFDGDTSRANPYFIPLLPQPIHKNEPNRQLIMDTETTGLDALKGDRVIEVGIVEMIGRKFTGEKLHVYINPQRGMDEEVIRIHGISEAFLTDKPTFNQVAQQLYDFMDGAEIIAHNASFDMSFLNMEFNKVGLSDFADRVQVTDSLMMAKQQYPGQKNTLDALVRRLDVGKQDRTFHGALLDSEILAEVYLAMTGGQVSLPIEEDSQSNNGQASHMHFNNLADLLLASSTDANTHRQWYANLADEYPEIKTKMSLWSE